MTISKQIAKHFHDMYFGGNWTASNLKKLLKDVSWEQATTKVWDLNTIATLTFHISYYVTTITDVIEGKPLTGKDKFSFDHPPLNSQKDWDNFIDKVFVDAKTFTKLLESFPEDELLNDFVEPKYGNYYRNFSGLIEHTHYHLGQIALIKKLLIN